jgi:hypothetical protein
VIPTRLELISSESESDILSIELGNHLWSANLKKKTDIAAGLFQYYKGDLKIQVSRLVIFVKPQFTVVNEDFTEIA